VRPLLHLNGFLMDSYLKNQIGFSLHVSNYNS
jgi:hypothetical protein